MVGLFVSNSYSKPKFSHFQVDNPHAPHLNGITMALKRFLLIATACSLFVGCKSVPFESLADYRAAQERERLQCVTKMLNLSSADTASLFVDFALRDGQESSILQRQIAETTFRKWITLAVPILHGSYNVAAYRKARPDIQGDIRTYLVNRLPWDYSANEELFRTFLKQKADSVNEYLFEFDLKPGDHPADCWKQNPQHARSLLFLLEMCDNGVFRYAHFRKLTCEERSKLLLTYSLHSRSKDLPAGRRDALTYMNELTDRCIKWQSDCEKGITESASPLPADRSTMSEVISWFMGHVSSSPGGFPDSFGINWSMHTTSNMKELQYDDDTSTRFRVFLNPDPSMYQTFCNKQFTPVLYGFSSRTSKLEWVRYAGRGKKQFDDLCNCLDQSFGRGRPSADQDRPNLEWQMPSTATVLLRWNEGSYNTFAFTVIRDISGAGGESFSKMPEKRSSINSGKNVTGSKRVRFARGATSTIIRDGVSCGTRVSFVLGAKQGQKMVLSLLHDNEGVVRFSLSSKDHLIVSDITEWKGTLDSNGDYSLSVYCTRNDPDEAEPAYYEIYVEIEP
jgi:hypothetical protein